MRQYGVINAHVEIKNQIQALRRRNRTVTNLALVIQVKNAVAIILATGLMCTKLKPLQHQQPQPPLQLQQPPQLQHPLVIHTEEGDQYKVET